MKFITLILSRSVECFWILNSRETFVTQENWNENFSLCQFRRNKKKIDVNFMGAGLNIYIWEKSASKYHFLDEHFLFWTKTFLRVNIRHRTLVDSYKYCFQDYCEMKDRMKTTRWSLNIQICISKKILDSEVTLKRVTQDGRKSCVANDGRGETYASYELNRAVDVNDVELTSGRSECHRQEENANTRDARRTSSQTNFDHVRFGWTLRHTREDMSFVPTCQDKHIDDDRDV